MSMAVVALPERSIKGTEDLLSSIWEITSSLLTLKKRNPITYVRMIPFTVAGNDIFFASNFKSYGK